MKTIQQFFCAALALCLSGLANADTYTYDVLNRLTAVAYSSGGSQTYSYDAAGNLLSIGSTPPATGNHTLAVSVIGSGTVSGSGINCGTTCSASLASGATATLTATPASGSTFTGWGGACSGTGNCVVSNISASTNVSASFSNSTGGTYTLNISRSGTGTGSITSAPAGINCGASCSASFAANTSVTLTATPATGSSFAGWAGDCTGQATCTLSMSAAKNASASFISNGTGSNLSYPLAPAIGWNLLGNSLNQALPMVPTFSDPAAITTVWKWDTSTGGWQFYAPSMTAAALQTYATSKGYGVLSAINPGEGYWVNAKAAATLVTQTGAAFSLGAVHLVSGWNLAATADDLSPSAFNRSISATPPSPGVTPLNLTTLWAWDNATSAWYFYAPSLEANGGLGAYTAGKGYLDFSATGKTLGNGTGFWVNKP